MRYRAPRVLTGAAVVAGALVFPPLCAASCHCSNWGLNVYTESCGYGANCTQANINLSNAIISEARSFCQQAASPDVCSVSYTPNSCYYEPAVGQWLRCAPSYTYYCEVCLDGFAQSSSQGSSKGQADWTAFLNPGERCMGS